MNVEPVSPDPVAKRAEERTPLEVIVDLSSVDLRSPAQAGVTVNVSARGARVLTTKPWKPNERLNVRSLLGSFRSRARVVYCVPAENNEFAVGLQFFAAVGQWRVPS
ncbi:MAG: PilZ domain-containing protein [Acidobacteria bacterium]|nr:PilZ domain-containing protein [Acidobacteriota bacterium]